MGEYAKNSSDFFASDRNTFYIKVIKSIRYIIKSDRYLSYSLHSYIGDKNDSPPPLIAGRWSE